MAYWTLLVLCSLACFSSILASVDKREVTTTLYPDCDSVCKEALNQSRTTADFPNVVYVKAASSKDVMHFVLSTVGLPTLLVVHTSGVGGTLNFNWTHLLRKDNVTDMAGGINVTGGNLLYSFAVVFSKLVEYDDVHDTADVSNTGGEVDWNIRNFTEFKWMNVSSGQGGRSVIFNTTSSQPGTADNKTGSLSFEFEINDKGGRDDDLPRLIFNANNTQMNFVLDKYVPSFNKSRFALEVTVVSQDSTDSMHVEETKSIDDEYSPGVFRLVNWYTQQQHTNSGGYLQYKPVCYLEKERSRAAGTEVSQDDLLDPKTVPGLGSLLDVSLARAFFGNQTLQKSTNISFGLSQDGFYVKNNYTAWTASVGYGTPPTESISQLVIIIIVAGLGIPVLVIMFGGLYVCIRKFRSRDGYQQLDNVIGGGSYSQIN